jgi:transcriptional regulator with XRE-family HTH domain
MPTPHLPSAAVRRTLRKLGADIRDARRRRRLPMAVVAERAFTSRSSLQKVEAGDANVSISIYAAVLHSLGLLEGLGEIADIQHDVVGQALTSPRRRPPDPVPLGHGDDRFPGRGAR